MNVNFKLFSEQEIIDTYKTYVVKDKSYYTKANDEYKKLSSKDKEKLFSTDFPRVASLFDYKEWVEKYDLKSPESLLSTFRGDLELQYVNPNNITYFEYMGNGDGDLHTINLGERNFDFIIFNQTLEHLYNPFLCMKNLYDHLKPGGYLYTTVPTINIPHMVPFHFWGMTPIGLCMLGKSVGFNVCECGFWGNYEYLGHIFTYNEWPNNDGVFDDDGNIKTTDLCQSQTWVLLQKQNS
jgi:SAM-dependent methyltransferase